MRFSQRKKCVTKGSVTRKSDERYIRDPRGTATHDGHPRSKHQQQMDSFCSNLLDDLVKVPTLWHLYRTINITKSLCRKNWHCQNLHNFQKLLSSFHKSIAQADELAALHPRRFSKAMYETLATRCNQILMLVFSFSWDHSLCLFVFCLFVYTYQDFLSWYVPLSRPLVEVTKLLNSLGLPISLHSGSQGKRDSAKCGCFSRLWTKMHTWYFLFLYYGTLRPENCKLKRK